MGVTIAFCVLGPAAPQGSMRAMISKKSGKAFVKSDNTRTMPFRQDVGWAALRARSNAGFNDLPFPKGSAVQIRVKCYFQPPKTVPKGRYFPVVKPDYDKLLRSISDALTGVLYADDCQIVDAHIGKRYDKLPRTEIVLTECPSNID